MAKRSDYFGLGRILSIILAIIPITLVLAFWRTRKEKGAEEKNVNIKKIFPFITY